jgi:hypothetical protein
VCYTPSSEPFGVLLFTSSPFLISLVVVVLTTGSRGLFEKLIVAELVFRGIGLLPYSITSKVLGQ